MAACSTWDRAGEDMNEVRVFCVCLFCLESCGRDWGRRIEREREREREREKRMTCVLKLNLRNEGGKPQEFKFIQRNSKKVPYAFRTT